MKFIERLKEFFINKNLWHSKVPELIKVKRLKRVYSYSDLPKTHGGSIFWDTKTITDPDLMDKIYNHIVTSSNIIYYCSNGYTECSINTKRYGWVLLVLRWNLCFTKFGICKSNTRYDINYEKELAKSEKLHNLLSKLNEMWRKEYLQDMNL